MSQCASRPKLGMRCSCQPRITTPGKKRFISSGHQRMPVDSWRQSHATKPAKSRRSTSSQSMNSRSWPAAGSEKYPLRPRRMGRLPLLVGLRPQDGTTNHQAYRRDPARSLRWYRKTRATEGRAVRILVPTNRRRASPRVPSRRDRSQNPQSPIPLLTYRHALHNLTSLLRPGARSAQRTRVAPPSSRICCPVMNRDSSASRYSAA